MPLSQSPEPTVTVLEADCDLSQGRMNSLVALVEFGQRQARIELKIKCHVSTDLGLQDCARIELHHLLASLQEWLKSHSPLSVLGHPRT